MGSASNSTTNHKTITTIKSSREIDERGEIKQIKLNKKKRHKTRRIKPKGKQGSASISTIHHKHKITIKKQKETNKPMWDLINIRCSADRTCA